MVWLRPRGGWPFFKGSILNFLIICGTINSPKPSLVGQEGIPSFKGREKKAGEGNFPWGLFPFLKKGSVVQLIKGVDQGLPKFPGKINLNFL